MDPLEEAARVRLRLSLASNLNSLREIMDEELAQFGFERFAYVQLSVPADVTLRLYLGTYPIDWSDNYRDQNLQNHDPLYGWALKAAAPFTWAEVKAKSDSRTSGSRIAERLVYGPGADAGLRTGGGIPIHGPHGATAVLQVSSDCKEAEFEWRFQRYEPVLQSLATALHERASSFSSPAAPHGFSLTARQKDVLQHMVDGKDNWEIATILGISPETVKSHKSAIFRILGVDNSKQAVSLTLNGKLLLLSQRSPS